MKKTLVMIIMAVMAVMTVSCDFLDVIPQGKAEFSDLFKTHIQADKYVCTLYSVTYKPDKMYYATLPDAVGPDLAVHGLSTVSSWRWQALFYDDLESPSSTQFGIWDTSGSYDYYPWKGIRVAYDILDNADSVPDATDDEKSMWKGEAYCMIGYLHMNLLEYYGPIPIVDHQLSMNEEVNIPRQPFLDCVQFISDMFDKAFEYLPDYQETQYYGRFTKAAAISLKARLWLYAASPWINGNSEWYGNLRNNDGEYLIPQEYDPELWKKTMDAADEAIQYCESMGYILYEATDQGSNDFERGYNNFRAVFTGNDGSSSFYNWQEHLVCSTYYEGSWTNTVRNLAPRVGYDSYTADGFRGFINPTFDAVEAYWSKNGLPMDVDPETKDLDLYSIAPGDSTVLLHRNREPRFYASIGYDRGDYDINGGTMTLHCHRGEEQEWDGDVTHLYFSCTGYFVKKLVAKGDSYNVSSKSFTIVHKSFPFLRTAENYLTYAEAEAEYTGTLSAKGLEYINKVRHRAGIPNLEDSWALVGGLPTGQDLVDIIRQERLIELEFEARWYHDLRRWKMAGDYYTKKGRAWNLAGSTTEEFYQVTDMEEGSHVRTFETPKNYWLAVPQDQININSKLVQNTGYNGAD